MIKYAIFDLDDTVLDFHKGEIEYVSKILSQSGVKNLSAAMEAYLSLNKQIWEKIEAGAKPQALLNTRFSKTLAQFGIVADGVALEAEYRKMLNHNFYTIPGAKELLESFKRAGVTLLVGTNGVKQTQLERLQGAGLNKYFDAYFISEDIGYSKPNEKFFKPILQIAGLNKANSVMIGDRLQSDILGANRVGMKSIWYNPQEKLQQANCRPTYTVNNYQQIKKIVLNG